MKFKLKNINEELKNIGSFEISLNNNEINIKEVASFVSEKDKMTQITYKDIDEIKKQQIKIVLEKYGYNEVI